MTDSFAELLQGAKDGEPWAWERIFRTYAPPVTGYLALRGADEPEDLTSETLFHVARSIESFTGTEESFRSWIFVIAHRRLIDARRSAGRRVSQVELKADLVETGGDVESEALDNLALAEMQELLEPLTEEQRSVVALRLIADLSLERTAEIVGKRVGSVKALQRRALASLKRHIESQGVSR
jgi:RNA polymerase sigma factor (sigma-70 family)